MAQELKIISGILIPTNGFRSRGSATINFSDGSLASGSNASFSEVQVIGSGTIKRTPCKQVSLRKIRFHDDDANPTVFPVPIDLGSPEQFDINDFFVPSDDSNNPTGLRVTWSTFGTDNDGQIAEISFMIIGET